jgi:DNA-binding Lrp family transcriptional regulator/tetratricopeptide (TPR) repeat protein
MNQPIHNEMGDRNQRTIAELVRTMNLSQHHFSIILVHCNYRFLQQRILQEFQNRCFCDLMFITLDQQITTLHSEIQYQLREQIPQAVMILGIDEIDNLDQVLSSSNHIREEFRNSFPFPLLLWVTDIVLRKLIQLAPDLESWTTTFDFEASTDELLRIVKDSTEHIYAKALDAGAHGFVPQSLLLDSNLHFEVESAFQELLQRQTLLPLELEARMKFVFGLSAYNKRDMQDSRTYFEQSLKFWQDNRRLKHQGCVLYYLGLWWRRSAALSKLENGRYKQDCAQAEYYFRQCVAVLEQTQRPDLTAKFINALGEVLQRQSKWDELSEVAQTAIHLHQSYSDPVRLAFALGLLAETRSKVVPHNWTAVKELAEQALNSLDQFEALYSESVDSENAFLEERQNNRGWYTLLLAKALKNLGAAKEAVTYLERAQKNGGSLHSYLHIEILETLRDLYFESKNYQKAFQIKRKQYSIQQQYGLRAFVGAGYLQPSKSIDWTSANSSLSTRTILASEIEASGRHQDVENLVEKIRSPRYKLITIYGPSGVGKSSLINAGLAPKLEQQQRIGTKQFLTPIPVLRKYNQNRWLKDLGNLLKKAIEQHPTLSCSSLLDTPEQILGMLREIQNSNLIPVLIFDQFEEFFFASDDPAKRRVFYQFLGEYLTIPSVKIVISIREDCLHYLLECNRTVYLRAIGGDILSQDFLYFLGNLSVENAKALFLALTSRTQIVPDPDLIEALVEDLSGSSKEISPIELQLVGAQLEAKQITTLSRYHELGSDSRGRIRALIQAWLHRVIKDCGVENESTAWKVLQKLTHREKIRTIKTQNELMSVCSENQSRMRERQIKCILEVLEGSGLISKLREDSKNYYQLVHDYLVPYIDEYTRHDKVDQSARKLKQQLTEDDLTLRLNAIIQLGEIGVSQFIKPLKQLLEKSSSSVSLRWQILKAMAQIKDDETADFLVKNEAIDLIVKRGLGDPEAAIQAHAAHLLGQLQHKPSAKKLLAKCKDEHRCVRVQARWAVKQLGEEPPEFQEKTNPLLAFILMKGSAPTSEHDDQSRINHLKSLRLRDTCGVVECGNTCGNYDFLIKILAENIESLNELVMGMIPHLNWVKLTRTFVVVTEPRLYYWRRPLRAQSPKYISYVWIETSGLNSDSLVASLMDVPEVSEVATVYGGFDVIAKIEAEEPTLRDTILTQKIARLPFVNTTVTYPVIMSHAHSYWDNSKNFKFPSEWLLE